MRRLAPFVVVPLLLSVAHAESPAEPSPEPSREVKSVMAGFFSNVEALYPFMVSERPLSADEVREIQERLDALSANAQLLRHMRSVKTPGYALGAAVLSDHLASTGAAFRSGQRSQARWLLAETLQGCIGCHAQLPERRPPGLAVPPEVLRGSTIDRANLLFATRGFEPALDLYGAIVHAYPQPPAPGETVDEATVSKAIARSLAIHLRVRRDPAAAVGAVEAFLANEKLPAGTRRDLAAWRGELLSTGLLPSFHPKDVGFPELSAYVQDSLRGQAERPDVLADPRHAARELVLSGVLYEFVALNPAAKDPKISAQALLWLATCDRALDTDPFFSMADLYLEDCVRRAPHTPVARRCVAALDESTRFSFTGSAGTDLPDDVIRRLSELRRLAR